MRTTKHLVMMQDMMMCSCGNMCMMMHMDMADFCARLII